MCGIVGYFCKNSSTNNYVENMLKTIDHRGPDDYGIYTDKNVSFGHVRLSILDLSDAGHQPMVSSCGGYVLVYNGEIYNFKEIKQELESKYTFVSHSDTEVVLYAIIEYGIEKALDKFNGMFAFSFYDKEKKELYLARDRMGVKPLYYYHSINDFMFASELKAFARHPSFKKNIEQKALVQFLQFGYIPSPWTIYENCFKLEPATYIKIDIEKNSLDKIQYWCIDNNLDNHEYSYTEYLDKTLELLHSSVKYRMIADVPVASFLSGGIDSSLVTALMKEENSRTQTFTIGFHEEKYNEAKKAKRVAEYLGTNHHEYYCSLDEVQNIIPELPYVYDEPYADSSAIPTILLSRFTSKSVKVAMSADGGDELFGGYNKYIQYNSTQKLLNIPYLLRRIALYGLRPLSSKINRFDKIESLLNAKKQEDIFKVASTAFQGHDVEQLLKQNCIESHRSMKAYSIDFQNNFMLYDMMYLLEGDILTKVDRATMSASLESREPLLDYRLVELSINIPSQLKFRNGQKSILKDIAKKFIPQDIIDMPKQGFNVPVNEWLKNDLKFLLDHYLSYENISKVDFFETDRVIAIKEKFLAGKEHVYKIWYLLSLMMWFEKEKII